MAKLFIVVGTYTGGLIGLKGNPNRLKTEFAFYPSTNSIKSLSISDNNLYSSGFDECIRVFSLSTKQEQESIMEGMGSINYIEATPTHIITGNDSGSVNIWREGNLLHSMKKHRASITGLALHPSRRLLLSSSLNKKVIMWNLLTGRSVWHSKLKLEDLAWSPCGLYFIGRSSTSLFYFDTNEELPDVHLEYKGSSQFLDCTLLASDIVIGAQHNGELICWKPGGSDLTLKAHSSRIIAVKAIDVKHGTVFISLTSTGELKVWNATPIVETLRSDKSNGHMNIDNTEDLVVFSLDLKVRASCLAVQFI